MKQSERINLVYLAAASHSGSTLTAMLLGAHPDICTVGELKINSLGDAENYKCSCLKNIKECDFWKKISADMEAQGESFNIINANTDFKSMPSNYVKKLLSPLHRGRFLEGIRDLLLRFSPVWRIHYPRIQKRNAKLIRSIANVAGVNTIVDSSKIGVRLKYLLRNPDINVKVIWVVRDGRGVSLAYKNPGEFADAKNPELRGGGTGTGYEAARDVRYGAREWVRCNEEIIAALNTMPKSDWIKIRYEDVCNETEKTLDTIFTFIGVNPAEKNLHYRSVDHHVVGNGMRLDSTEEIRLDERWRDELNADELNDFKQNAGLMNRTLGYID